MIAHKFICDPIHGPASQDPVAPAPAREELVRKAWQTGEPPKDGREIVALGRVIYQTSGAEEWDEGPPCCTVADPFVAVVRWEEKCGFAGWHYVESGLTVARTLEDEVIIDFWLEDPR